MNWSYLSVSSLSRLSICVLAIIPLYIDNLLYRFSLFVKQVDHLQNQPIVKITMICKFQFAIQCQI